MRAGNEASSISLSWTSNCSPYVLFHKIPPNTKTWRHRNRIPQKIKQTNKTDMKKAHTLSWPPGHTKGATKTPTYAAGGQGIFIILDHPPRLHRDVSHY